MNNILQMFKSYVIGDIRLRMVIVLAIMLIAFCLWYIFFLTFVDRHELGYVYSRLDGQIEILDRTGWIVRFKPIYNVHSVDLRPYQVHISANERILNAKLVRFNPEGLMTFIEWHGRSAGDSLYSLKEILKCYAFDRAEGRDCPFLTVVSELAPPQGDMESVVRGDNEQ